MGALEEYAGKVQAVIWAAADYVSADAVRQAQYLLEHGEPAEGMHSLAWSIVNERRMVPRSLVYDIRNFSKELVDDESMPPNLDDYAAEGV